MSLAALLAGVLVVLSDASPAYAVELPNDAEGHRHVTGVLDVSRHRCGTYLRGGDLTGFQTSPSSYDYATPSPMGTAGANSIDRHWVQDRGALASALVFDLAEPVEEVDLFPAIDHGPVPGEALESTVYGFDRLDAPTADWEVGDISVLFDQGWSDWISDDWVSRWGFQEPHRYIAVSWGGPKALLVDDDNEIDAVCAPPASGVEAHAGADQDVTEGQLVTLDGSASIGFTAATEHRWELISASGPPVALSSVTSAQPSFRPFDDGVYRFRLTVSEAGLSDTDEVEVRIANALPVIAASAQPTADDAVSLVTATLTDPGMFDTHRATYDWGDGSAPETLDVLQGPGWGYAHGGHVYPALGSYTVTISVTDDDGGESDTVQTVLDVGGAGPADPRPVPAVWGGSSTKPRAVEISGGGMVTAGLVHSNNDLKVSGSGKRLLGGTEYVTTVSVSGSDNLIDPPAVPVDPGGFPVEWQVADYLPGGAAAVAAGTGYHDMSAACHNQWWDPSGPLAPGLYFAPCSVRLGAAALTAEALTVVATGAINVSGDSASFLDAHSDGLLFLSASGSKKAITFSGSGSRFGGSVFAPTGGIEVSGSDEVFECGLLGDTVTLRGENTRLDTPSCRYATDQVGPIPVAAPPLAVPTLSAALAVAPAAAPPGATLAYDGSVTNEGADLIVPGIIGVANRDAGAVTVDGATLRLEYFDEPLDAWQPLASTADGSIDLEARPIATTGATYPASGIPGTTVAPGGLATWGVVARARLDADQIAVLLDPVRVSALRVVTDFATSGGRTRTFGRFADNLIDGVRTTGGPVTNVELAFTPGAGEATVLTASDLPGLASVAPGAIVAFDRTATVPTIGARGPDESSRDYLDRLAGRDGTPLVGALYATGRSSIGALIAPQQVARAATAVPVVEIDLIGPAQVTAGSVVTWDVRVRNAGSATATALTVALSVSGVDAPTVEGLPTELAPGQEVTGHATATQSTAGETVAAVTALWTATGTSQTFGPSDDSVTTRVGAATDHPITLGSVQGRFFHAPAAATAFTATPADTPVFAQSFPSIAFNPPEGVIAGNSAVTPATRPFTDVVVGPEGEVAGVLPAQAGSHQAGVGDLESFQSVFTGQLDVTRAGSLTISVIADDGFIFGVEGATRVAGPLDGAPTTTPFEGYSVVGAHNAAGALATYPVTINFPSAGRYRFELDYFTSQSSSMSLVLAIAGAPGDPGGGRVFLTGHDPDFHAYHSGGNRVGAQHIVQRAIAYVTKGSSAPRLLLVTDVRNPGPDHIDSRLGLQAAGYTGFDVADHGSGTAGILDLRTLDLSVYDAIVVASDHGGWLRQEQLDVLNSRIADIDAYLADGGGLVAFAEGSPGAGLTTHDRFGFVRCPGIGFDQTESGFQITPQGVAIGLNQSDLNGNFSHSFFPDTCGLDVLNTDAAGRILSLATPGTVSGPTVAIPPSNYLLLSPESINAARGATAELTVRAFDSAANPRVGIPVAVDIVGPNTVTLTGTTDAAGTAVLAYQGDNLGVDTAQATAVIAGDPATSNVTVVTWTAPGSGGGGGGGSGPATTITGLNPGEGATITEPTPVAITSATPPDGTTTGAWRLTVRPQGTDPTAAQPLASGAQLPEPEPGLTAFSFSAAAAGEIPLGTFDPTVLRNGMWVLRLEVDDAAGGTGVSESAVVVDGGLKLGEYTTSYLDLSVPVGGIPIQVQRTYSTLDRGTTGEFGHGWTLQVASFRAQRNRALGDGGWEQYSCGTGLIFVPLCYRTSRPHFVTVTWPDGHTESFDFTPKGYNTFFPILGSAAYTGRRGTTSRLEPVPGDEPIGWRGDGNLYGGGFGEGPMYDPQRFVLVARDGTRYLLDRTTGLVSSTDRAGNTVTVDDTGIRSSQGPSITFTRDPGTGRIDRIDGPEGTFVEYGYDAGDLDRVIDANGNVHDYGYEPGHLLTTIDEPGAGPFRTFTYEGGRLKTASDGVNTVDIDVTVGTRQEAVTTPDGLETTLTTFDARGNPVVVNRIFDGVEHRTTYEYNEFDDATRREDPEGNVWSAVYDTAGNLRSVTDAELKVSRFDEYNAFGLPQRVTGPDEKVTRFEYDLVHGGVAAIVNPLQQRQSFGYDDAGNVTSYSDGTLREDNTPREWQWTYTTEGWVDLAIEPDGSETDFDYDAAGRVRFVTDATDVTTEYRYDAIGNLRFVTEPLGRETEYRYDERDRLTDVFDGEERHTHRRYDDVGNLDQITVGAGPDIETTTFGHTPRGLIDWETNLAGDLVDYAYDGGGRLVSVIDGEGRETAYGYDLADRPTSITWPNETTDHIGYDGNGRRTSYADTLDGEWTWEYDANGALRFATDPLTHRTEYAYDDAGRLDQVFDPLRHKTDYDVDAAGRPLLVTNGEGEATRYGYDDNGRLASATDAENRVLSYGYDPAGRLNEIIDGLSRSASATFDAGGWLDDVTSFEGVTTQHAWDRGGLLDTVTDELGHQLDYDWNSAGRLARFTNQREFPTVYTYDDAGRLAQTLDARGGTVGFGYDHASQLTSITDPRGKTTNLGYNPLGGLASYKDPLQREWTWTPDELGRRDLLVDPLGQQIDFKWDAASRLEGIDTPEGLTTYTWDAADRPDVITGPAGAVDHDFDAADRLTQVTSPAGIINYAWDDSGLLEMMGLPQGDVGYSYDAAGGLDRVTDWTGGWVDYDTDGDGRLDILTRSNGVITDAAYDPAGRLDTLTHTGPGGPIDSFDYVLDEAGNRRAVTSNAGTETYDLDELNRLTAVEYPDGQQLAYSYDAAGNRDTQTTPAGTTDYVYDDAGQLTQSTGPDGTVEYEYDLNGNLLTAGTDEYGWDWANRMISATVAGQSHSYTYDGTGLRSTADGAPQLWDRVGLPNMVGDGSTAYLHDPYGGLQTEIAGASSSWALGDALGSTRALTNPAGSVVGSVSYDAYGAPRSTTGATSAFGFTGEQTDPTGLVHLRARTYDPGTGRFLSPDTVQPNAPGTQGWNRYAYVANNPTTWTDPTGNVALVEYATNLANRAATALAGSRIGICIRGAFSEIAEGLAWSAAFGGSNPADFIIDGTIGCVTGGVGSRPRGPDTDDIPRPRGPDGGDAPGPRPGYHVDESGRRYYDIPEGSTGGDTAYDNITQDIRDDFLPPDLDPPLCSYCRQNDGTQIDHVDPRSQGGNLDPGNTTPACGHCNPSKRDRPVPKNPPANYQGDWPPAHWPERMREEWFRRYGST